MRKNPYTIATKQTAPNVAAAVVFSKKANNPHKPITFLLLQKYYFVFLVAFLYFFVQ